MKRLILPIGLLLFASCYSDKEDELYPQAPGSNCDTNNAAYITHVQPIISQYCATSGCHDATTKSNGYDMSTYSGVVATANSGRLLGAIRHESGFSEMPQGLQKLNDCEISQIEAWVNQGMSQ